MKRIKVEERLYTAEEELKLLDTQRGNCWLAAQNAGRSSWKDVLVAILNAPMPKIK